MKIDAPLPTIAVIGTGNMGPGIAATLVPVASDVRLIGRSAQRLQQGLAAAAESLGILGRDPSMVGRIHVTTDLEAGTTGAAIVIEAVAEDLTIKRELFQQIDRWVGPSTILASTTSALMLSSIIEGVSAPERTIVLHYFYPPALIPVVEVVRGDRTSDVTVARAVELLRRTGKQPVVVNRSLPGFIGNRLLHALMSEAIALVREGVASAEDIDAVVRGAFTLRLVNAGPLESADLVGLDLIRKIHAELLPSLQHLRSPDPYLVRMVEDGNLGAKTGRGFYDWSARDADLRRRQIQEGVRLVLGAVAEAAARR